MASMKPITQAQYRKEYLEKEREMNDPLKFLNYLREQRDGLRNYQWSPRYRKQISEGNFNKDKQNETKVINQLIKERERKYFGIGK